MAAILQNFVDAHQWEAEDIVGRLGMVMHAAFLFAGFQPYGAQAPPGHHLLKRAGKAGSLCLSRWYTAPQLAHREGADAAVLMVCAQGSDVALVMFLTASRDWRSAYLERLDAATVTPLLSRALGDTEPWASRICRAVANGACWGLLSELCRGNSLPLTSFMSLPDDIKAEILKRLADPEDLARVERTCRHLRRLVAERDGELWKPMYEALSVRRRLHRLWRNSRWGLSFVRGFSRSYSESEDVEVLSWKKKFVEATRPGSWSMTHRMLLRPFPISSPIPCTDLSSVLLYWLQDPPEQETVSTRGESTGGHRRKVPRITKGHEMKWHGAGAIYSPSSRYRWKHR
ncbi:hypothetical protein BAE44_0017900 [Dichanthelium oligosanthes]|uniref:F-box domain-containing protein n=1 Tax=Dichanthelium oligosanthes TaxID=888268 RepID=A0A1E5V7D5_9POAL|nr:hypothetical protein BAE44_0017900 [Dichanthelium oligosanthes]